MLAAKVIRLLFTGGAGLMLQMTAGIIAARVVGPYGVGIVAWMGIWPMYIMGLSGGVLIGAERNVPMARGAGKTRRAEAYLATVWSVMKTVSCATLLLTLIPGLLWPGLDPVTRLKWCGSGGVIVATLINAYALMGLSTSRPTKWLHIKSLAEGLGWWVLLPLAWLGASGLAGRLILVTAGIPLVLIYWHRLNVRAPWHRLHFNALSKVGYPIMATRMALLLLYGLDKTLIALLETDLDLGHYSLVALVLSFIKLVPLTLSQIIGPQLGQEFGRTGSQQVVARKALAILPALLALLIPILGIGYFLAEPLTRLILPDFMPGLAAAKISLLAGVFIAPLSLYIVYNLTARQRDLLRGLIVGLIAQLIVTFVLYRAGTGLAGYAWGFVAGMGVAGLLTLWGVVRMAQQPPPPPTRAASREGNGPDE